MFVCISLSLYIYIYNVIQCNTTYYYLIRLERTARPAPRAAAQRGMAGPAGGGGPPTIEYGEDGN